MLHGISYFFIFARLTILIRIFSYIYRTKLIDHKAAELPKALMPNRKQKFIFTGNPQIVLLIRLLIVLIIMTVTRLLLYFFHPVLFPAVTLSKLAEYAVNGFRFDLIALLWANSFYFFLMILPFRFRRNYSFRIFSDSVFCISNTLLLIPNLADIAYFPFTLKRMTFDIFEYISIGEDTSNMMPRFLLDYWYLLLILIAMILLLIFVSVRIRISARYVMQKHIHYYLSQTISMILFATLAYIGIQGGIRPTYAGIQSASEYAPSSETALVLNSTYSLIQPASHLDIQKEQYFADESKMLKVFNAQKNYSVADSLGLIKPMLNKNILIIILESFSAENTGTAISGLKNQNISYTPFLDSLASKSLVFDGFANGKRSIEGIPAILASLPSWMPQDFITSDYSSNRFHSLASLLKTEDYSTSFFHGGQNGTMMFDTFCKAAGFDSYYGKNEYPDPSDFDGNWGIWDEPYLQYIAGMLNESPKPFVSAVFTLSSHHPYKIPEKYRKQFKKGPLKIQETIMYTDFSLQRFFESAARMPWFNNTIFVITSDHTSESLQPFYNSRVGQYNIPVIFYDPQVTTVPQNNSIIAQQTDIMPTLLDMLHYPKSFIAFGGSLLRDNEPRFSLSVLNGNYQLVQDKFALQTNLYQSNELYRYTTDPKLSYDIYGVEEKIVQQKTELLKSVIQQYNNRMIGNKLLID